MCVGCAFSEVDLTCKMKGKCVRGTFAHGMQMIIKQYFHVYTHLPDSCGLCYKWKNHFYEMKGDVGMSLHEKERNKMMPIPRHNVTHNPIPTSLLCCLFVCYECIRQSKQHNILTSNCLHENVRCSLGRNKDVGMGL